MIIGLTGGIGSGKTTILNFFEDLGAHTYSSDLRAKALMSEDDNLKEAIKNLFGDKAYLDSELNRPYIAEIVFQDSSKLEALNNLVHPAVHNDFKQFAARYPDAIVIYESALLLSSKLRFWDYSLGIIVSPEQRLLRVMKRDGLTREQVESRMSKQLSNERVISMVDYLIYNDNLDQAKQEAKHLFTEWMSLLKN
ncbi:MAG: dephospho-CoA kinase [Flavobacteriaceae bacterium]